MRHNEPISIDLASHPHAALLSKDDLSPSPIEDECSILATSWVATPKHSSLHGAYMKPKSDGNVASGSFHEVQRTRKSCLYPTSNCHW